MKRCLFIVFFLATAPALAQPEYEYAIHFLCGRASGEVVKSYANSPGVYFTAISVTNLDREAQVKGIKRFVTSFSSGKQARNTKPLEWSIDATAVMRLDCSDIYGQFDIEPGKFIEGFVHLVGGPVRFDVAAVYTLFDGNYPASIDIEHLAPR